MPPKARRARASAGPASRPQDRGRYTVAGFLARRLLAFSYCAAFLSLGLQVEGLFGCSGVFPAEEASVAAMTFTAWLGSVLAGVTFLALGPVDESSTAIFATLWFCYAACLMLMPDGPPHFYPFLEDKFLLEAGLAVVIFAQELGAQRSEHLGRLLSAWCLFRFRFAVMFKKMSGSCAAYRNFSALQAAYQLEAFPLPSTWPLQLAPAPVLHGVMAFQAVASLLAAPWLLSPSRSTQVVMGILQLLSLSLDAILANQGSTWPCSVALIVLLFDDAFLKETCSHNLLESWGCSLKVVHKDAEEETQTDQYWPPALLFLACCAALTAWSLRAELPGELLLAFAASALLVSIIGALQRAVRLRVGVVTLSVGAAIFLASMLQLHRDLVAPVQSLTGVSLAAPPPLDWLAKRLEDAHVAHAFSLGPDAHDVCPEEFGRADLVLQGYVVAPTGQGRFTSLSSRQLPAAEPSKKPPLVQPYSPRMDYVLWQLAQKKKKRNNKTPAWLLRLAAAVAAKRGAAAELAAGPFQKGIRSMMYGNFSDSYAKLEPPVPGIRIVRFRHLLMQDVHSEKWFNRTEAWGWADFEWDDLEPVAKQLEACAARPWAALPIEEGLASLLVASFLWRVFVAPANR